MVSYIGPTSAVLRLLGSWVSDISSQPNSQSLCRCSFSGKRTTCMADWVRAVATVWAWSNPPAQNPCRTGRLPADTAPLYDTFQKHSMVSGLLSGSLLHFFRTWCQSEGYIFLTSDTRHVLFKKYLTKCEYVIRILSLNPSYVGNCPAICCKEK